MSKKSKVRKHKPAKGHGPTWPHTDNQCAQSRPVTVLHPIRAILKKNLIPGHMARALGGESRHDINNFLLEGVKINV